MAASDADTILADISNFEPTIIDLLTTITAKKPVFDNVIAGGVSNVVLDDLATLNVSTSEFGAALVAASPVSAGHVFYLGVES